MVAAGFAAALTVSGAESVPVVSRELPPIITNCEIRANARLSGKKAFYYCDDVIWLFRDLTRQRPKSLFDNPFLRLMKEAHDKYGMKVQLNCFYRTDFFYGTDEFTLKEMTDVPYGHAMRLEQNRKPETCLWRSMRTTSSSSMATTNSISTRSTSRISRIMAQRFLRRRSS